jgi:transposase
MPLGRRHRLTSRPIGRGAIMATITIDVDLPEGVTIAAYQRHGDGHGFEVTWPLPGRVRCDRCRQEHPAELEYKNGVQVIRDLDVWGQPSFWIYQPAFHRCPHCHRRQALIPPFKRKDTSYTHRFEKHVLALLIGSNVAEVARRLGVSAEMVELIVRNQLADARAKQVDPARVVTDVGVDELSLKKRHKLFVTILTDLSDPERPEVLAVAEGRDEAAARECLERLGETQRRGVGTYRADMAQAFHNACRDLLPKAKPVVDRFHVAKLLNEAVDGQRKKNHPGVQGEAVKGGAAAVPVADVALPQPPGGVDGRAAARAGGVVPGGPAAAEVVRDPGAVRGDL